MIPSSRTLGAPIGLVAYGHNPSPRARDEAIVGISWDDVPGATWYWVQYTPWKRQYAFSGPADGERNPDGKKLWKDAHPVLADRDVLLDSEQALFPSAIRSIIYSLNIKTPYIVRVAAVNNSEVSTWSERVYAYATTTDPVPMQRKVLAIQSMSIKGSQSQRSE